MEEKTREYTIFCAPAQKIVHHEKIISVKGEGVNYYGLRTKSNLKFRSTIAMKLDGTPKLFY